MQLAFNIKSMQSWVLNLVIIGLGLSCRVGSNGQVVEKRIVVRNAWWSGDYEELAIGNVIDWRGLDTVEIESYGRLSLNDLDTIKGKTGRWRVTYGGILSEESFFVENMLSGPYRMYDDLGGILGELVYTNGELSLVDTARYYYGSELSYRLFCEMIPIREKYSTYGEYWEDVQNGVINVWDGNGRQVMKNRMIIWPDYYSQVMAVLDVQVDPSVFDCTYVEIAPNVSESLKIGAFLIHSIGRRTSSYSRYEKIDYDGRDASPDSYEYYWKETDGNYRMVDVFGKENGTEIDIVKRHFYGCDSVRYDHYDRGGKLLRGEVHRHHKHLGWPTRVRSPFPDFLKCLR
jgi:hypothetical protein